MASINKLSIRGVRAFSPEDTEQVIEFFCPLTIIVGMNGCGKTTIIESLKYAITGSLPPDSRKGQSFVHDAKAIGQQQVKACVKLRFTSKSGQSMVVVRSMELTQKKTTMSFKQLDGVLRTMDPETGERQSLSHKCSELDKTIPQLMGVSKAILEHVLFCHQEDASWPLMEPAHLKKRFDEIFDSARYTKAIEAFKKKEKSYNSIVKDLKAEVAGFASHKHAAKGFKKELAEQNDILQDIEETKDSLKAGIEKLDRVLEKYEKVVDEVCAVEDEIKSKMEEQNLQEAVITTHLETLEEDLTTSNSLSDLNDKLRSFDRTMAKKQNKLQELQQARTTIMSDIEELRQQERKLSNDAALFQEEKRRHEELLHNRCELLETLVSTYSIDIEYSQSQMDQSFAASVTARSLLTGGSQDSLTSIAPEDLRSFLEVVDRKGKELEGRLSEHKRRSKQTDDELELVIQDLSGKVQVTEADFKRLKTTKESLQQEQQELSKEATSQHRIRASDVEEAREKANRLAKEREEANQNPRRKDIVAETRNFQDKIEKLVRQIDEDRGLLEDLRASADSQNAIDLLKDQCAKDIEVLEEAIAEQASLLQKFNLPVVKSLPKHDDEEGKELVKTIKNLNESIQTKFDETQTDLESANADLTLSQRTLSEKTALMDSMKKNAVALKAKIESLTGAVDKAKKVVEELRRYETSNNRVARVTEENPKELLAYIDGRLTKIDEDAPVDVSAKTMKKIVKRLMNLAKVSSDSGVGLECPCCRRDFIHNDKDPNFAKDVSLFQNTLGSFCKEDSPLLRTSPEYEESKNNYESWKSTLTSCMDDLRDYQRMSKELKEAETEQQRLLEEVGHYNTKLRDQQNDRDELQSSSDEVRDLLDRSRRWIEEASRVEDKRLSIAQKKIELSATLGVEAGRSLKDVESSLNKMNDKKDEYANKITALNRESSQLNEQVSLLNDKAHKMEQLAKDKEEKFAESRKTSERKNEVLKQLQSLAQEEKKLRSQLLPLEKKLAAKREERIQARNLNEQEQNSLSDEIASFSQDVQKLRTLSDSIEAFEKRNKAEKEVAIAEKMSSVKSQIVKAQQDAENLQPEIEEAKRALGDQERHKTLLTNNIRLIEARVKIGDIQNQVEDLREKLNGIEGGEDAASLYQKAKDEKEKLQSKAYKTEGRFAEVVEQIRSLKRKLNSNEYKDVEEQYRVALIKLTTTKAAAEDLKKYYTALDKALLLFHGRKIEEINRIIRELWLLTYKGQDISNIELVSGQEPGSKASKSYNYRVVMSKGSSRLDMRGRCSAGQRVLASIVIRLALAETFGVNCGCIALDEPTVNLDYKNKKGLAIALAQIVASRSTQKNFQLLMITHDEEFVAMMKTELSSLAGFSMPEKYFHVRREQDVDGKYYSKIDAHDWNDMA